MNNENHALVLFMWATKQWDLGTKNCSFNGNLEHPGLYLVHGLCPWGSKRQGCALDLLAPSTLLLSWQLIIYELQLWRLLWQEVLIPAAWCFEMIFLYCVTLRVHSHFEFGAWHCHGDFCCSRLVTCFLFFGPLGLPFIWNLCVLVRQLARPTASIVEDKKQDSPFARFVDDFSIFAYKIAPFLLLSLNFLQNVSFSVNYRDFGCRVGFFQVHYCSSLEGISFQRKTADFLWMLLCGAGRSHWNMELWGGEGSISIRTCVRI